MNYFLKVLMEAAFDLEGKRDKSRDEVIAESTGYLPADVDVLAFSKARHPKAISIEIFQEQPQ